MKMSDHEYVCVCVQEMSLFLNSTIFLLDFEFLRTVFLFMLFLYFVD